MNLQDENKQLLRENKKLIQVVAGLSKRVDSSMKILAAISSITAIPNNNDELKSAFNEILQTLILELTGVDACSILLYNPEKKLLELLAAKGQADMLAIFDGPYNGNLTFQPGEGISGYAFNSNTPVFWDQGCDDDRFIKKNKSLSTPVSLACLPLSSQDKTIGVLNISFSEALPFDESRKRALLLLGSVINNVLHTFTLRSEVSEKAASLQKAHDLLELRVEARTREVLAASEDLRKKIKEQRKDKQALKESEERYRLLVEGTSDGFFIAEIPTGRFHFLNLRLCRMLGLNREEAMGMVVWETIIPQEQPLAKALFRKKMENGSRDEPVRHSLTMLRQDGSTYLAEISISMVTMGGHPVMQGVIRDITDQERLRQQLHQSQKLEAIGTLAGGIAHDFNNILTAMMGYADLVRLKIPAESHVRPYLDQVLKAGTRARDLVKQILAFSRQTKTEKRPVQIGPIVKETVKLLRALLPATIQIRESIIKEKGAVLADPTEIHQVIMNLGNNAGQAMRDKGGLLEMELKEMYLSELDISGMPELSPGPYVRLTVKDTGCGMDPDVLVRIFEPYYTTKTKDQGTGLGLAVVHGIVKEHGGAILVSSVPGRGATFQVFLPKVVFDRAEEPTDLKELLTGNERILFIDDEEAIVDMNRRIIQHLGYRVTTCTSSVEALEIFKRRPHGFDLVITDQTMPHLTGVDIAREILQVRPDMPIILCTGFSENVTPDLIKEIGIRRFVMKPLVAQEISETIRSVLDPANGRP